ncbi:MAG: endonuclease/exonuclease/phosphatase family protein [Bacteroidales bacterium]|nr:endonuclease/exonuclease/phosphatase family protein [Bacteroidales bacterium]
MKAIIYTFLKYLNYFFVGALLLSYLSVFISPEKLWVLAFFGLAYPFLLIVNVGFVVFWIYKKRKTFLIPLIAILIGWTYLASYIQVPLKKQKVSQEIVKNKFKVLSFNVRLFDLYNWREGDNTSDEIFDFINTNEFDFICFQEFFTKNTGDLTEGSISKMLEEKYTTHIDYTFEGDNYNYGIATFSKYPIINRGIINFSNSSNSSIFTDVLINEDTIRIFNNHLQSIRFNKNNYSFITNSKYLKDDERLKEIKDISYRLRDAFIKRASQARILSSHIQNSPFPVIVCGDFNDVPVSYTYRKMKNNLNDSYSEAGKGIGNTYKGKFPSFRIDFIFHSEEIKCMSFDIPDVHLSDHFPVTSEFVLER